MLVTMIELGKYASSYCPRTSKCRLLIPYAYKCPCLVPRLLSTPVSSLLERKMHRKSVGIGRLLPLPRFRLRREACLPPRLPVPLSKPLARLDHLHNIDPLLEEHDGRRSKHQDPRHGGIHLVGSRHLHGGSREWAGEEHRGFRSGGRAGLNGRRGLGVREEGRRE